MLLICLALGAWQVERLFWKQDLIAQRQAAVAAAPAAVPKSLAEARDMEFHHVSDEGVFLNDKEIFSARPRRAGGQGYQVLTPLLEPGGRVVFVNRGYIPAELRNPQSAPPARSPAQFAYKGCCGCRRPGGRTGFCPTTAPI